MSRKPPFKICDKVKIIAPEFFVRCGYPLSLQDALEAVDKSEVGEKARALLKEVGLKSHWGVINSQPTKWYDRMLKVLAVGWLEQRRYGGTERTIHTKRLEELEGKVFQVIGQKFYRTGTYVPATQFADEWEPPTLVNQVSHRILLLGQLYSEPWTDITSFSSWPLRIEACHVEKVE